MATRAQTALARGYSALLAQFVEIVTWQSGANTGTTTVGVRQSQQHTTGQEGRGTLNETVFVLLRESLPTTLPEVGDTLVIGSPLTEPTFRVSEIRPGQKPGTVELVLEEVLR